MAPKHAQPVRKPQRESRASSVTSWLVAALLLFWVLAPLYLAVVLSIKPRTQFFRGGQIPFLDFAPTLDHWRIEFAFFWYGPGMGPALVNSVFVGVLAVLAATFMGGLAAYGLLRLGPRQIGPRRFALLLLFLLLPRLIPPITVAMPFTRVMQALHLYDTRFALWTAHTTLLLPWALVILYSAMLDLSPEILEAAQLDGCSDLHTLLVIVAPLIMAPLLATMAICMALSWNEYPFAVLNAGSHMTTVPVAVAFLFTKDGIEFEFVGSHLLLAMLPPMLLALGARRFVTRALSLGTTR